jgi:hypothetical protein
VEANDRGLSQHLAAETKENSYKPQSERPLSRPRVEPNPSRIRIHSVATTPARSRHRYDVCVSKWLPLGADVDWSSLATARKGDWVHEGQGLQCVQPPHGLLTQQNDHSCVGVHPGYPSKDVSAGFIIRWILKQNCIRLEGHCEWEKRKLWKLRLQILRVSERVK